MRSWRKVGDRVVKSRAQMLAIVLYTGCDCNYAMCAAERSGDYDTWRWFSWLLGEALRRLQLGRHDDAPVAYSGEGIN